MEYGSASCECSAVESEVAERGRLLEEAADSYEAVLRTATQALSIDCPDLTKDELVAAATAALEKAFDLVRGAISLSLPLSLHLSPPLHLSVFRSDKSAWHIDGIPNGKNGVPSEMISNFTALGEFCIFRSTTWCSAV